jgi:hypothetical protein
MRSASLLGYLTLKLLVAQDSTSGGEEFATCRDSQPAKVRVRHLTKVELVLQTRILAILLGCW